MDYTSFSNPSSFVSNDEKKTRKGGGGGGAKLSTDPQSVAARQRRHRISHRFKILQSLVPGGSKLDTVSMLEEAIQYVKFLKAQIWLHQSMMGLVDQYANAGDDPPSSSAFLVNSCTAVPGFQNQGVDLCGNVCSVDDGEQLQAEIELGWPVSCFSGEENIGPF